MYRFVEAEKATFPVATMCRVLGVAPSGYWAWRGRGRSRRELDDAELTAAIRTIHRESRGTYGAPRVHAELIAAGRRCGRKHVARLMRADGLVGVERLGRVPHARLQVSLGTSGRISLDTPPQDW